MRLLLVLAIIISFPFTAGSSEPEASFGVRRDSREWKRLELENWLQRHFTEELSQFVPPESFKIYANVRFKDNVTRTWRKAKYVTLPKLGIVSSLRKVSRRSNPAKGVFDKVHSINYKLIVDEGIPQETSYAMVEILKSQTPLVAKWRVKASIDQMIIPMDIASRNRKTFGEWVIEFKVLITLLTVIMFTGIGVYLIARKLEWHWRLDIQPTETNEMAFSMEKSHIHPQSASSQQPAKFQAQEVTQVVDVSAVEADVENPESAIKSNYEIKELAALISKVGPENENSLFKELIANGDYETFEKLCYEVCPKGIILKLEDLVLYNCLARLPFSDRILLLAYFNKTFTNNLLKIMSDAGVRDYDAYLSAIEEIAQSPSDVKREQKVKKVWSDYVGNFRKAYQNSRELKQKAKKPIQQWMWHYSSGVVGVKANDKKSA